MNDYINNWSSELAALFKPSKPICHQKTCPACGRKLVNIYRRDGVWKCRNCWVSDEAGEVDDEKFSDIGNPGGTTK